jgi:hypothetical protein
LINQAARLVEWRRITFLNGRTILIAVTYQVMPNTTLAFHLENGIDFARDALFFLDPTERAPDTRQTESVEISTVPGWY